MSVSTHSSEFSNDQSFEGDFEYLHEIMRSYHGDENSH